MSDEQMADDQLVILLTQGDLESLGVLYYRYGKAVFGFMLYLLKDPHLAEEVTQEVFLNVWPKAAKFNPERGTFHAWLMTMAHHRAIDERRRDNRQWQRLEQAAREATPPQNSLIDTTAGAAQRLQESEVVRSDLRELQASNDELMELVVNQRDFSYVSAMPEVPSMTLQSTEETPRARGMLMTSSDHTWGILYSLGLEPQADEMAYQGWHSLQWRSVQRGRYRLRPNIHPVPRQAGRIFRLRRHRRADGGQPDTLLRTDPHSTDQLGMRGAKIDPRLHRGVEPHPAV